MTLRRAVLFVVLGGSVIGATYGFARHASSLCWQAPEALSSALLSMVRTRVSATGAQADQFRNAVGLLEDSPDSVYVVTNETVCRRGAVALTLFKGNSDTLNLYPILVIKAGRARYVLDDGDSKGGEFMASYVADTSYSILGGLVH